MPENPIDCQKEGKRTIAINSKTTQGRDLIRLMCQHSDVLIEPFRPGVMEKLGLGPEILLKENPRLIFARLNGFGQSGPLAKRAGHDINYVALSGVLSFLGRKTEKPTAPLNLIADFAGGGLLCAFGVLAALLARDRTGEGQIVDNSMVEGAAYVGSWLMRSQNLPIWGNKRGENMLDTGRFFYDTYETKDGKFMSVGCIERQFFEIFTDKMDLADHPEFNQFGDNEICAKLVTEKFREKTQKEWCEIFEDTDACVYPVLDFREADCHRHNKARDSFMKTDDGLVVPNPAPKLNKTPAISSLKLPKTDPWTEVQQILAEVGKNADDINKLVESGAVLVDRKPKM